MANAIRGRGAVYDVRPEGEHFYGGPISGLIGFFMDTAKGACAGLLTLLGGTHMMGSVNAQQLAAPVGLESITTLLQQFSMGGFSGPVELLGGIVLFLTARRTIARTLGLLAFIAMVVAYTQGYTLVDLLPLLSSLFTGAAGALDQFAATQSV